jgi:carbon storage regulator CsrA
MKTTIKGRAKRNTDTANSEKGVWVMLVLTRKASQQIQIGDGIVITILQVKGNTVRVGIEAPREVRVIRGELESLDDGRSAAGRGRSGSDAGGRTFAESPDVGRSRSSLGR